MAVCYSGLNTSFNDRSISQKNLRVNTIHKSTSIINRGEEVYGLHRDWLLKCFVNGNIGYRLRSFVRLPERTRFLLIFTHCTEPHVCFAHSTVLVILFYQSKTTRNGVVLLWCPCTTRLEPILRKNAEKHKPRRLACASARCAPPEKTLCIFFEISPAKIFLEKEKGFFCRVRFALWQNSGVNSKIISSGLPLCDLEPPMLDRYGQKIYQEIKARRQSLFPDSRSPKGLRVAFMPSLAASFLVHENCR